MQYRTLGKTDLRVSQLCLGSMTWGTQNTAEEAFAQIDLAREHGINIIDTAELYPTTPLSAETQGFTEEIIGQWLKRSKARDDILIASKVAGNGPKWIDDGKDISPAKIKKSVENSLKRLKTDYIDLYQLHWPNRGTYHFRQTWKFDPTNQNTGEATDYVKSALTALQSLIDEGKIRYVGLSNESCWGTMQFINMAKQFGLPRVVSIQNEYSLMHRIFDLDFAELSHHEDVGLLAFSPLAAGMLSGKYDNGTIPEGSRRAINENLTGRYSEHSLPALNAYIKLARDNNLDPAQMALAFCMTRPFMTSVIIGATTIEQLQTNLAAAKLELSAEVMQAIADIYRQYPLPM